jgi:PEGA domain-containing protein
LVVASDEGLDENRAKVLAAAHAAASWARARRATWTDAPLPVPGPVAAAAAPAPPPIAFVPEPEPEREPEPAHVEVEDESSVWSDTIQPAIGRWAPRLGAAALVGVAVAAAVRYGPGLWRAASSSVSRLAANAPRPSLPAAPAEAPKTTGTLHIVSTPSGARVLVDGAARGVTPLTLDEVAPGRHTVVLQSPAGTIQRVVAVAPGTTAEIDESIFSGWVAVYAPFELTITESGRVLRADDRSEIMLPAGPHDLRLANRALGFEQMQHVELKPGDRISLSIKPPQTSITVTATEPAEVWLDGVRVGDTPLAGAPVDLGTHELLVRRVAGGDRRMTIRATVQPVSIVVDFNKP